MSTNWGWVGSLLTVGTNVKIRGLTSASPEETYETCNKLDFHSCQRFILTLFSIHHDIYLIYVDKLPIVLWLCVWLPKKTAIKIVTLHEIHFFFMIPFIRKCVQSQENPVVADDNTAAVWQVQWIIPQFLYAMHTPSFSWGGGSPNLYPSPTLETSPLYTVQNSANYHKILHILINLFSKYSSCG